MENGITDENYNEATFELIEVETPEIPVSELQEPEKTVETTETPEPVVTPEDKNLQTEGYRNLQRIAEQRKVETYKEQQARIRAELRAEEAERKLQEFTKPKEEVLEPPKPPQDPTDPTQVIQYLQEKVEYQDKVLGKVTSTVQNEQQMRQAIQEGQAHKQHWLGEIVKAGASIEDANKAYESFIKQETVTGENLYTLYLIKEGKYQPAPVKKKVIENAPTPPGITGSENEPLKTPDDEFNSQLRQTNKYKL